MKNERQSQLPESGIAIVGMSCLFPQAKDLAAFWSNIVGGKDCLRNVSDSEWNTDLYYDRQSDAFNRVYCRRGGFVSELADFDPLQFGVMPTSIKGTDPDQLLALKAAWEALQDAGYQIKQFDKERAGIILGRTSAPGSGSMNMIQQGTTIDQIIDVIAKLHPEYSAKELSEIAESLSGSLSACSSDTIPGVMPNVMAGRIAGRLGFKGRSLIMDAACASSLVAVEIAVHDLNSGLSDLVIAGGVHINSFAIFYQMFCGLQALSRTEIIRPFDDRADGTLLGEGTGMVVLKRLEDAVRDQDRIYCVLRGIGTSSDGHGTSMLAPSIEGEALAIQRAYDMAGISPRTVQLLEAHGTGTPTGDVVEMRAVEKVFQADEKHRQWCAIGSVKSNIGHCQAASGIAGLIKAALSLYHRVLPPTLNATMPNKEIKWLQSPCFISQKTRPWLHATIHPEINSQLPSALSVETEPRRAAVSAFGFGGINAHAVLEEFSDQEESERPSLLKEWDSEVCLFSAESDKDLVGLLRQVGVYIEANPEAALKDIAYTLAKRFGEKRNQLNQAPDLAQTVAIVAQSSSDLRHKIAQALTMRESNNCIEQAESTYKQSTTGIYFSGNAQTRKGKLAFVLPGLGAAYPNMLSDLCLHFPDVRAIFDFVDHLAVRAGSDVVPSEKVFPIVGRSESTSVSDLANLDFAVVMLLMAEWALYTVLQRLCIQPDALVGVSTGEFAVLTMSGASDIALAAPMFYHFSTTVARSVPKESLANLRTIKVDADAAVVEPLLAQLKQPVYLAASLSQSQCLISGAKDAIAAAQNLLRQEGLIHHQLPTAIPYHTPLVDGHIDVNQKEIKNLPLAIPQVPAWSCSDNSIYPQDVESLRVITTKLFTRPILLKETIQKMYESGVTKFIEVGPKGTLTPIINEILQDKPHLAFAANLSIGSAINQLHHLIASLACHDVPLELDYLYKRRTPILVDFNDTAVQNTKTHEGIRAKSTVKLSLAYPEVKLDEKEANRLRSMLAHHNGPGAHNQDLHAVSAQQNATSTTAQADNNISPLVTEPDSHTVVMENYFKDLAVFHQDLMETQSQIMSAYLNSELPATQVDYFQSNKAMAGIELQCTPADNPPLSSKLIEHGLTNIFRDENAVVLNLTLTVEQHQYLLDHAIGGTVSSTVVDERVYLLPLTVALEMMAEAGSLIEPNGVPVCFQNIRAARRIRVGLNGCRISIVAKKNNTEFVDAAIYVHQDGIAEEITFATPAMSCRIDFAAKYEEPQEKFMIPAELMSGMMPRLTPDKLYSDGAMFHGPRMRSVSSITRVSKKQILGEINARDPEDWLPDQLLPSFVADPLLLDNATQLVLFYLYDEKEEAHALLPFFVDSLEIKRDLNLVRGKVTVFAQLHSITQRGTEATVNLIDENSHLIARFNTITSRRILLDRHWSNFVSDPMNVVLAQSLDNISQATPAPHLYQANGIAINELPGDDVTLSWCLDYVLSAEEQQYYELNLKNSQRGREWLTGRIAAKEAVRSLILRYTGVKLCLADISVGCDEYGKPFIAGDFISTIGVQPLISIAHKNGLSIALAGLPESGIGLGIDLEMVKQYEDGFEQLAFTAREQRFFSELNDAEKYKTMAILWSAKEAAGKATGLGLRNDPKNIEIIDVSSNAGKIYAVKAVVRNIFDTMGDTTISVAIATHNSNIIALAILSPMLIPSGH